MYDATLDKAQLYTAVQSKTMTVMRSATKQQLQHQHSSTGAAEHSALQLMA
eukprot:SAG31_NODE_2684_length_5256_cov_2.975761_6_plen_51_part_00